MTPLMEDTIRALAAARARPDIFLSVTPDRAETEARAASDRAANGRARGSLDGATVCWKDMIAIAGTVTTAGSALRRNAPPARADAAAVARAAHAGLITIGKTNQSELAFSGIGHNPHFGTPAIGGRAPGGSSSGAAAAVAMGITRLAVGTDTAGSCRVPAAFQGIVGFRPTRGRYPMAGVLPLSPSYDTLGIFTRGIRDIVLFDAVLSGDHTAPLPLDRILADKNLISGAQTDPAIAGGINRALDYATQSGLGVAEHTQTPLSEALGLIEVGGWPGAFEASRTHAMLLASPDLRRVDPFVAARLRASAQLERKRIQAVQAAASRLRAELAGTSVAYALPTVAIQAPLLAPLLEDVDAFAAANATALRLTMPASLLNLPALSLPIGQTRDGAWIGLQLVGPPGSDRALLATAAQLEPLLSRKECPA